MDKVRSEMTERILNLTLEIIYLLTGENYIAFKRSDGLVAPSLKNHSPVMGPSPSAQIHERKSKKKVQEVINKIIELLTREVPIRCQDVTVCFSVEEWEYLEGHTDLYKDVMMEHQPPLLSPDEASNRNPSERWTGPLYSQGPTLETHKILTDNKDNNLIIVKEETDEPCLRHDEPHNDEEKIPSEISPDGQYRRYNMENLHTSPDGEVEDDDSILESSEANPIITPNLSAGPPSTDLSSDLSTHGESFTDHPPPVTHNIQGAGGTFPCSACGECFTQRAELISHQITHMSDQPFLFSLHSALNVHRETPTMEKPYSCSECGKSFSLKTSLATHEKAHARVKPYSCLECGKSFSERSILVIHKRIHTAEKLFSCSHCGKSFAQSGNLVAHQRIHTGEKPFSCSDCGERFSRKSSLIRHRKLHTGEKPYICDMCGKCFIQRDTLLLHQRTHTGDRPYTCSQCGKQFAKKTSLMSHLSSHGKFEVPALECGS